jgi:simple sugar transport system ATP-binding protein
MSDVFLRVNNIYKSFAGVKALRNVSMTLNYGEARCLVGENGCGKSTLIKVISGVYKPDSGTIELNGEQYEKLEPMDAINNGIQVIYQDFSVFPNLTVAENIAMNTLRARKAKLVNWKFIRKTAQEALDRVGVKMDLDTQIEKLSVADRQLIAICRSLLNDVKLIIMDEPTTALTKKEVNSLLDIIRALKKDGISTVFVSHKLDEVMEVSDTVTIMRNGEVVADGLVKDFDMSKFVYYMTGRELKYEQFVPAYENQTELLRVENLSAKGGFKDISFTLNKGDVFGITGLLGSGRAELAQTCLGITGPRPETYI